MSFHFVPVWPLKGATGSAPKSYLNKYLENDKEFLNNC